MPFHFCWDEVMVIMYGLPIVGYGMFCLRNYWHKVWHRGSSKTDGCCKHEGHDHDGE